MKQQKNIKLFAGIFIVLTLIFSMMIFIEGKEGDSTTTPTPAACSNKGTGFTCDKDLVSEQRYKAFLILGKQDNADKNKYTFGDGTTCYKGLCGSNNWKICCNKPIVSIKGAETIKCNTNLGFTEQPTPCDTATQISDNPPSIKRGTDIIYCCKPKEDKKSATDISPSIWTQVKWDFEKLCLGENKELSALNDKYDYLTNSRDCLSELSRSGITNLRLSEIAGLPISPWDNTNIGFTPYFQTSDGKRDKNKIRNCINNLENLGSLIPNGDKIVTADKTIGQLNTALLSGDAPLTKEINTLDSQIKKFPETHRATGWLSAERWVSLVSCAYGIAGGILLAKDSGSCEAEVPLVGTEYCGECGDEFMPCTAERCGILGNCRAIAREDGKGYMCLPGECVGESSRIPVINQIDSIWYQGRIIINDTDRVNARTFNRNIDTDLIDARVEGNVNYLVNTLNLTITLQGTDGGKCRYSFENGTAFASMTGNFENNWRYPTTQSALIDLSGLALGRTHTIFIKCESTCGSVNEPSDDSQYVKFTFEPRPDALPPEIVRVVPDPNTQYLNNESRNATIEVWLNENGYCKYSTINETGLIGTNLTTKWNQTFTNDSYMAQMAVSSAVGISGSSGDRVHNIINTNCIANQPCGYTNELGSFSLYKGINNCTICYVTIDMTWGFEEIDWDAIAAESSAQSQQDQNLRDLLSERGLAALGLTGKSKLFHYKFRCADFGRDGRVGFDDNIMPEEETYDYQIFTYPPFNMTIIEPRNNGNYYLPVPLEVETSRETVCKYIACGTGTGGSIIRCNNSWENMLYITGEEDYRFIHETQIENMTYGLNTIYVRCRDRGNLEVMNSTRINVLQDLATPMIIRMSHGINDNALLIETDEKAECVVSFDKLKGCAYNYSSGSPFMTSDGYVHAYTWIPSSLHYVKCKDRWNNYPGGRMDSNVCAAVIDPIHIPEV